MIIESPTVSRNLRTIPLSCDLTVIGGGMAGVCAAITAARAGLKVVIVQDRPVLGGNASSEVRLWILGATSHMGNNNRWAREGGVIDEILVENMHRNPEGNSLILDTILIEWVLNESNITLLLNTAVHDLEKADHHTIRSVSAFCSQNSTAYMITSPLFCDASGDGIVGFLAGAAFRIGAEGREEFGELFAPEKASSDLLGHTIYFYSKNTSHPVKFIAPNFALSDITKIPRWRDFKAGDSGCRLWWIEWGGQVDTVHDSEIIKMELWKVAYGVWDYIKNSGQFPEAETLTLEWVGTIPGKRESRRFEGDHILTQQDIIEQRTHSDAVSCGGWAIDLHPVDGVYSPLAGCTQWHSKGVYQIPWRSMYSRNITNLMLAGRIISASHVAFGSTRVMATCAHGAQAVGAAAALCLKHHVTPRDLSKPELMRELQETLLHGGQFIPGVSLSQTNDLARSAKITATSELSLSALRPSGETLALSDSWAMMLPLSSDMMPVVGVILDVTDTTTLRAELRVSEKPDNHTPDCTLKVIEIPLSVGNAQQVKLDFETFIEDTRYAFICLLKNHDISVHLSDQRLTGVISVCQAGNKAVAKSDIQSPPPGIGIDTFEFWTPKRRPAGKNLALTLDPPLQAFGAKNLTNGINRPTRSTNAWVADFIQEQPVIRLSWETPQKISTIEIDFDTDFDHPMESALLGHPERHMPFCVRDITIAATASSNHTLAFEHSSGTAIGQAITLRVIAEIAHNHQTRRRIVLEKPVTTDCLEIHLVVPSITVPVALFAIRCFS